MQQHAAPGDARGQPAVQRGAGAAAWEWANQVTRQATQDFEFPQAPKTHFNWLRVRLGVSAHPRNCLLSAQVSRLSNNTHVCHISKTELKQYPNPAQVGVRFSLSAAAFFLFLIFFVLQLRSKKEGHLQTQYIKVELTPCSTRDCLSTNLGNYSSVPDCLAKKLGNYSYAEDDWHSDPVAGRQGSGWHNDSDTGYQAWEELASWPSTCQCSAIQSRSRKYVFNVDFPCENFTSLCPNDTSVARAWDLNNYANQCFPTPWNTQLGLRFANDSDVRNEVWDSTFNETTLDLVEGAGQRLCRRIKRLNTIRISQMPTLATASQLHATVVSALANKLAQFVDYAVLNMADKSHFEESLGVAYLQTYLDWLASRVTIYALSEVPDLYPAGSRLGQANASTVSVKPALLLPLRVQQELKDRCLLDSNCKYCRCDPSTILKGNVSSVWHYELYDIAMFGCIPYQCTRVQNKVWLDYATDVLVLAGGLWSLFFTVLPILWAVAVMGMLWGWAWCRVPAEPNPV